MFPRASESRNNAAVEFPVPFFQTGEETRSFQDLMLSQIPLIIPLFLISRHGGKGVSSLNPSAQLFSSGLSLLNRK